MASWLGLALAAPARGEGERVGQKGAEVGGEALRIGEKFLESAGQRIGAFHPVDGHPVDRAGDGFGIAVAGQPVLLAHPFGDFARGRGQRGEVGRQGGIEARRVGGERFGGAAGRLVRNVRPAARLIGSVRPGREGVAGAGRPAVGPVLPFLPLLPIARQQVVVEQIDERAGHAPPPCADARAAGEEGGVAVGKAVNGAMQGDARGERGRQTGGQRPLDEIAEQAADAVGRVIARQHGVREEVHRMPLPSAWASGIARVR